MRRPRADAPKARLDCPDNLVAHWVVEYGEVERTFAGAAHRMSEHFRIHKGGGHSIEGRAVLARYDATDELLTVWDSTQMPHKTKRVLVEALGLSEDRVRVIAPDVGGGFGPKNPFYPEELAIPAAALALGCPIKWVEDRRECFTATNHEREQDWEIEAAVDREGKLLAIRGHLRHDHGATTPSGLSLPQNSATNLIGPYVLPAYRLEVSLCLTNLVAATSTRGAGRTQGTFVMERMLDRIADDLGLGRDEVRRRNLISPQQMPYVTPVRTRDGLPMTYDSGDYPECQRRALAAAGWTDFPARREAARREGRWLGIGLGNYVEGTGRGPFESAAIRIGPSGKIFVTTGAAAQGQGTRTMLAQLAAGVLGVAPHQIQVTDGDTAASPLGLGAYASRQAVTAGNAVHLAALMVADKARQAVATMLEVAADDLELIDGEVRVKGVPQMKRTLAEVAHALSGVPGFALPGNIGAGACGRRRFSAAGADLYQRRPRGRGGGRRRDRRRAAHALRDRPRLRPHDQSHDGGGAGAWRRGARYRRDAAGMDALRSRRPAAHRHFRGLSAADRRCRAADRNSSHGIAHAVESARRQGRGRKRRHRRAGRHRLGDRRRVASAQGAHPGVAGDTGTVARAHSSSDAPLVSRFRSSHHCAAGSFANFGIEGH